MELTKPRKVSIGVLAVAIAALAADRMFLGAASPATAGAAAPTASAATNTASPPALPKHTGPTLASRLESIASSEALDSAGVEDLFAKPATPVVWRLTTTFGTGERAGVVIDGRTLRVGEVHGGAELVSVSPKGATFQREGAEFFVEIGGTGG